MSGGDVDAVSGRVFSALAELAQTSRLLPTDDDFEFLMLDEECGVPRTTVRIYRRFLQYNPDAHEDLYEFLMEEGEVDEASVELVNILGNPAFVSTRGKTKAALWRELCDIVSKYPEQLVHLRDRVDNIIRSGAESHREDAGEFWASLANYYIGLGMFCKARDVFEEGMGDVTTVRGFALVWDAYSEFEESLLQAMIEATGDEEDAEEEVAFNMQHARYEAIVNNRELLLNSLLLRTDPNNVNEWHTRAKLFKAKEKWKSVAETYANAVKTIDPRQAKGPFSSLYVQYALFYEQTGNEKVALKILENAREIDFRNIDDLSSIYCAEAEMHIRNNRPSSALSLLRDCCIAPPSHMRVSRGAPVRERLFRSTKLWCFLADLEESVGTMQGVKDAYDSMIDLKIATPGVILNYAQYLEENNYFEDSFRCFERGVDLFDYPYSLDIWMMYLTKFIRRYKGDKVERTRDIFEQAIETVPPAFAKTLFIMYADFEEKYGLARHAMSVYDRATKAVPSEEKYVMFLLYISRATDFFGVSRAREIYEKAIATLADVHMEDICLRYATMEKNLGEVDRARVIFTYCSNFCDPRHKQHFWQKWHNFEVSYGNEETFREMLRIKRSVQGKFNTKIPTITKEMVEKLKKEVKEEDDRKRKLEEAERIDEESARADGGMKAAPGAQITFHKQEKITNPDEMDISEDSDESEETDKRDDADSVQVVKQKVPAAVFGGIKKEEEKKKKKEKKGNKRRRVKD